MTFILNDIEQITMFFNNITLSDTIIYLEVPTSDLRKHIHIEAKKLNLRAHTYYKFIGTTINVKCDNCNKFSTGQSVNSCCSDDYDGYCNCTERKLPCQHCNIGDDHHGYIYYDLDNDFGDEKKVQIKKIFSPTSNMIIVNNNTPYKHLNTKKGGYRKWYRNN